MILVTVGTHDQGFNRLIQPMDELAAQMDEPVIIQRGSSTYQPRYAEHFQLTTSERMAELTATARVVVTHAAAGAIIFSLQRNKPLIVVPRLKRFNEVVDDHQMQLARALADENRAIAIYEPTLISLQKGLVAVERLNNNAVGASQLISALCKQIHNWNPIERTQLSGKKEI